MSISQESQVQKLPNLCVLIKNRASKSESAEYLPPKKKSSNFVLKILIYLYNTLLKNKLFVK